MARFLALFMGAWLSLVQSDAGLFHACDTGRQHAPVLQTPADGHAHHEASHGASQSPAQHDHNSGDNECHCIGHCCVTTLPALRAPDTFALVGEVRITTVQPGRVLHEVVAEWADYVLPFATAPPAVIVG